MAEGAPEAARAGKKLRGRSGPDVTGRNYTAAPT